MTRSIKGRIRIDVCTKPESCSLHHRTPFSALCASDPTTAALQLQLRCAQVSLHDHANTALTPPQPTLIFVCFITYPTLPHPLFYRGPCTSRSQPSLHCAQCLRIGDQKRQQPFSRGQSQGAAALAAMNRVRRRKSFMFGCNGGWKGTAFVGCTNRGRRGGGD